jgi:hypothetical protein
MTEAQLALVRRAVACRCWRWVPGMLCIWPNGNEFRVSQVNGVDGENDLPNYPAGGWGDDYSPRTSGTPDLTDPATLGCLLALVRQAWGAPLAQASPALPPADGPWFCYLNADTDGDDRRRFVGPTEAAALVAALEAAP